ncbi:MAG TPA: VOC family protein [Terriglobales bacterium]|nr:VOC family protein [Terriglobales bacterium]
MNQGIRTVIYPVKDVAKAKKMFCNFLGVEPYADQPYYVGFKIGEQDIGLVPMGQGPMAQATGTTAFYHINNIKQSLQSLLNDGAKIQQDMKDVGGGRLVASATDADGNIIGLIQG